MRIGAALSRAPLGGNYPAAVAIALLALSPFIVLTTAAALLQHSVIADLHTTRFGYELSSGLANGAYAFGAVVAADLIQRLPGRRLYVGCEALFVVGSLLGALSFDVYVFNVARAMQGLATGMLLVAALPPLITQHGPEKLPGTAAVVNLGLFGMVTLGPVVGGLANDLHWWRELYGAVAVLGLAGLALGLLGFEGNDPPGRGMGFDWFAIPLAFGATIVPFVGVSWLSEGAFSSPEFIAPLAAGVAMVIALVVIQYRKRRPLMPVRIIAHTLPVVGVLGAMVVGAAFTTLLELLELYLLMVVHHPPAVVGFLLAGQIAGVALAAWLFKRALPTKWTPYLALSGMAATAVGAAVLLWLSPGAADAIAGAVAFLLGYGAGAGVTPGLFMAGLSVPSTKLGPTFALVELLRSEAAFMVGPVLLALAMAAGSLAAGVQLGVVIMLVFDGALGVALVGLYLIGGATPHPPDLDRWLQGESSAYHSPAIAARVRDDVD
ncbi:MAG: MFS transporter [Solirubrobacteraceae bacterium]